MFRRRVPRSTRILVQQEAITPVNTLLLPSKRSKTPRGEANSLNVLMPIATDGGSLRRIRLNLGFPLTIPRTRRRPTFRSLLRRHQYL